VPLQVIQPVRLLFFDPLTESLTSKDVMVSKLNSDRKAGESAMTAISRIYGNIGMRGLFNGLGVRIIMIGTLTGAQWLIYDSWKAYLGVSVLSNCMTLANEFQLPTTGGH
jgi:hypothetical protein